VVHESMLRAGVHRVWPPCPARRHSDRLAASRSPAGPRPPCRGSGGLGPAAEKTDPRPAQQPKQGDHHLGAQRATVVRRVHTGSTAQTGRRGVAAVEHAALPTLGPQNPTTDAVGDRGEPRCTHPRPPCLRHAPFTPCQCLGGDVHNREQPSARANERKNKRKNNRGQEDRMPHRHGQ